jgi:hypothetical protein
MAPPRRIWAQQIPESRVHDSRGRKNRGAQNLRAILLYFAGDSVLCEGSARCPAEARLHRPAASLRRSEVGLVLYFLEGAKPCGRRVRAPGSSAWP